jgi:hypothetical protein
VPSDQQDRYVCSLKLPQSTRIEFEESNAIFQDDVAIGLRLR